VGQSKSEYSGTGTRSCTVKAALMAALVIAAAATTFHFSPSAKQAAAANSALPSGIAQLASAGPAQRPIPASSLSFPMFFEPNVGQTDSRVKFLARGSGYGLFLTSQDAVLSLQHPRVKGQPAKSTVVRMHLDGANSTAQVQGVERLPGTTNYFIGNDPSKWHKNVPQFGRVEYERVYPGIDLAYYGNQQQLEYDFRLAPGADPNLIALDFAGASAHIDSGDLVLSTAGGDIRFRAPHIYQPQSSTTISGGFRQLAGNKIGFTVGPYDHSRELIIDPVLTYSTYLGLGGESLASIALDFAKNIYLACSTTAADFPVTAGAIQGNLNPGAQNVLIAVLSPLSGSGSAQLLFATYLGSTGTDSLGGIAVDPGPASFPGTHIYVAGTTNASDFPTTTNAFQTAQTVTFANGQTHGFLSAIDTSTISSTNPATLSYSTFLAGNTGTAINGNNATENDIVTGIAIDSFFDAYVTGTTESTDILTGFPSTSNAYQICPWQVAQSGGTTCPILSGPKQFFASEINTSGTGPQSMLYSTFFGGGYPLCDTCSPAAVVEGGGIFVDNISGNPRSNVNMYFTGTTNMWGGGAPIPNGAYPFPLINAWQSCLNQSGVTSCQNVNPGTATDAFVVKLNPNVTGATPTYSTYLGGAGNDTGNAVTADTLGNSYVTGGTSSTDWSCTASCVFAASPYGAPAGGQDAYVAKITDQEGGIFPLVFFAYIGGSGDDSGNAIAVDPVQNVHIAGTTASSDLNTLNASQARYGGNTDGFVALLSSTDSTDTIGDYVTYLGGSALDQATSIAVDPNGATYVAGVTRSNDFPPANPYQGTLIGSQDAFVATLGANSNLSLDPSSGSPSPQPLPAGTQGTFTFSITNNGPDAASNVLFTANVPTSGVQSAPTAEVVSTGAGSCTNGLSGTIVCNVGSLAVGAVGQVAVFVTPTIPYVNPTIGVSGTASANGGATSTKSVTQNVSVTDFTIAAQTLTPNVNAGELAVVQISLTPNQTLGYNATVTLSQSTTPSMVTNPSPTFTINPLVLSGTAAQQTILNIQTVPRPVNSGSLFRHELVYAAWLPIGGLSLVGLIGPGRKRRRVVLGAMLLLLAGLILLQPACSSGSNPATSGGGTQPGLYTVTITASPGTGAAHQGTVQIQVR